MNKDEILQAFHLIAMGRARHPLHEQLAEELAAILSQRPSMADCGRVVDALPVVQAPEPVKRGPGRPKKAE